MTLPINITLPLIETEVKNPAEMNTYLRRLVYAISSSMQNTNITENGTFLEITNVSNPTYPFIQGTATEGVGTYTASTIYIRRINLMVYLWFDISWSGHTGTGNILITVPYFSQITPNNPFACVIESDDMTFSADYTYLTGNLAPNTDTIAVNQNGSGEPLIGLPISTSGHLRGSIIYAGQQFK